MEVTIPSEFEGFIEQALASGRYRSQEELLAAALGILRNRERKWTALREDIQAGLQQLDEGAKVPLAEYFRNGKSSAEDFD